GKTSVEINGKKAHMWQTLTVCKGDIISVGKVESGCRCYLSIRGGINVPMVLGSRSTYVRGRFGGINGRQLKAGDIIEGFTVSLLGAGLRMPESLVPCFGDSFTVRVVLGPQANMFTECGIQTFLSNPYKVTIESDRMGYRLEGPAIEHKGKADIVSDALLPGAIQVPKDGKPIILMRDAQTTGGYPKIGVAITPDLDALGQAKPNSTIKFSEITLREARKKLLEYRKKLAGLAEKLIRIS
ncbi:biotin-dependent carboxyltransferase, partial [Candidatus Bathyarchaeota archaeon]|nr:biotin-dependent carboxyltransferase [Candidatus Bathyarchaeota archaeon]